MKIPVYTAQQCHELLKKHGTPVPTKPPGFYELHTALNVFKSCWSHPIRDSYKRRKVIVNLVIPKGAHVYHMVPKAQQLQCDLMTVNGIGTRKMRADKAYVHSVYEPLYAMEVTSKEKLDLSGSWVTREPVNVGPVCYKPSGTGGGGSMTYLSHGGHLLTRAYSRWDSDFQYVPGRVVQPDMQQYDANEFYVADTCHIGVHFFMNLIDALVY